MNCPKCSETWNGIVGIGGHYTTQPIELERILTLNGVDFIQYTCPNCGYTEFYDSSKQVSAKKEW